MSTEAVQKTHCIALDVVKPWDGSSHVPPDVVREDRNLKGAPRFELIESWGPLLE